MRETLHSLKLRKLGQVDLAVSSPQSVAPEHQQQQKHGEEHWEEEVAHRCAQGQQTVDVEGRDGEEDEAADDGPVVAAECQKSSEEDVQDSHHSTVHGTGRLEAKSTKWEDSSEIVHVRDQVPVCRLDGSNFQRSQKNTCEPHSNSQIVRYTTHL